MKPDNHIFIIFGASGDLTWRKLIPAIYELQQQDMLPERFAVLGVGRSALSEEAFRIKMSDGINKFADTVFINESDIAAFIKKLYYVSIDTAKLEGYQTLKKSLLTLDKDYRTEGNAIYYLSTPPSLYAVIAENLGKLDLCKQNTETGWKRLIVEKPFGYDLETAQNLNKELLETFTESQLYRIDHYLGKETAQNILVTRFFNSIFEPLWNRNYIDRVEITSAESVGVEGRGGYYDNAGALRDMLQNHLLQLVALTAMEPPTEFSSQSIRNEVLKVFQSLRPLSVEDIAYNVIRGQYTDSKIKGERIPGYIQEEGVPKNSRTETFVAMKFYIDNWRWGGVPFYLRTGKKLPTRVTEITVHFKPTPHPHLLKMSEENGTEGMLVIRIQPDEGILLKFGMKEPGAGFNVQQANMDFRYSQLSDIHLPSSYERLIHDCMIGDASLFTRGDAVEAAWEFVSPILDAWKNNPAIKLYGYPAGSWGPASVDQLIDGNAQWRYPCKNLSDDGLYCEL
jgi:glucose-6-phosphate 1-dehydrogenase